MPKKQIKPAKTVLFDKVFFIFDDGFQIVTLDRLLDFNLLHGTVCSVVSTVISMSVMVRVLALSVLGHGGRNKGQSQA